jgi:hypothetical protein
LDGAPSTFLKFGLLNESTHGLTNIVVEVLIRSRSDRDDVPRVAGPYTLTGKHFVLRPGETLDFELRLRNLSSDCNCVAHVTVVSAQPPRDDHEADDDITRDVRDSISTAAAWPSS